MLLAVAAQARGDPPKDVAEEGGVRALAGAAADLLVVEDAADVHVAPRVGGPEALRAAPGALEVVQPPGGEVCAVRAPDAARHPVHEVQVMGRDRVRVHARLLRDDLQKGPGGVLRAPERHHVDVGLPVVAAVYLAVHVDRDVRDHAEIARGGDQSGRQAAVLPHDETPGHGQGTVQPGGHDHPAVGLRVQPRVPVRDLQLRFRLDLEGRGIAVRGRDHEAGGRVLRQGEGDEAGPVAGHLRAPAGGQAPALALLQPLPSVPGQIRGQRGHRVPRRGRLRQKFQECADRIVSHPIYLRCR